MTKLPSAMAFAGLLLLSPMAQATAPEGAADNPQAAASTQAAPEPQAAATDTAAQASQATQAAADDALLAEPSRLLQAGDIDAALPLLDAAIAQFEARYGTQDTRWYAARTSVETLAYLMAAAADADKGISEHANAKILPSDAWPLAWYLKGYALVEKQRFPEARAALERAVAFSPHNAAYLMELGQVLRHEQDWSGLLATATQAEDVVTFAPESEQATLRARAWRGQGFALIELGKLDEAEAKFRQALKIDANDKAAANEIEYIRQLRAREL